MTLPFSLVTIKPCEGQVSESRILLKKKKKNWMPTINCNILRSSKKEKKILKSWLLLLKGMNKNNIRQLWCICDPIFTSLYYTVNI